MHGRSRQRNLSTEKGTEQVFEHQRKLVLVLWRCMNVDMSDRMKPLLLALISTSVVISLDPFLRSKMRHFDALHLLVTFAIFIFPLVAAYAPQGPIVLPTLYDGPPVGVRTMALKDETRLDPFTNNTRQREVMLSVFYPADFDASTLPNQRPMTRGSKASLMPYMPPATAATYDAAFAYYGFPNGTMSQVFTRCFLDAPISSQTAHPLLIFSHGGGASRFLYTAIMEELARRGYILAAVNHPYDALVVEFPDGRLIEVQDKELNGELVELLVDTRAKDISFVLDKLSTVSRDLPVTVNTSGVLAFGHSLGGATAAQSVLNDTRIKGGINFDGRLFGSMEKPNVTISKPFLQFSSEFSESKPHWHWDQAWQHLSGWKMELSLNGSRHSTFSDFPLLAEATGMKEKLGKEYEALLGSVGGLRVLEIMVAYVDAFAEYVFVGRNSTLLNQFGNGRFPEVQVARHG